MSDYTPEHRAGDPMDESPVIGDPPPDADVVLSSKAYDKLKFVAQILLPGLGALYFGLAAIWGLPAAEQVVGTVTVLDTFLGLFLGVSSKRYQNSDARFDGQIVLSPGDEPETTDMRIQAERSAVATKDEVTLKVNRARIV